MSNMRILAFIGSERNMGVGKRCPSRKQLEEEERKPYSLNIDYAKLSDEDSDNTATIQYSATLSY